MEKAALQERTAGLLLANSPRSKPIAPPGFPEVTEKSGLEGGTMEPDSGLGVQQNL